MTKAFIGVGIAKHNVLKGLPACSASISKLFTLT